ncbi:MAG: helix-turn-helix domain-containing protein [Cyclobacteriaceae bacterium]
MLDFLSSPGPFMSEVISLIDEHLGDENFGVSELAESINMSRSNLLRKVKNETGLSVSVLIRQVRLHRAKDLLEKRSLTVSEIAFRVGFSSTSYFTKCFRELYGYPPGEHAKQQEATVSETGSTNTGKYRTVSFLVAGVLILGTILFLIVKYSADDKVDLPRSVAVLPFKNDSADSTNVYLMNGLMDAILDNFQKVEEIRVTSRTTVEKYRDASRSIPELSDELDVSYFVQGSGQKLGDQILLTVQLIEGPTDRQLWSRRYRRELNDIFQLQIEVARNIAAEIDAIITPEENKRIEEVPTNNLVAYDYYLRGLALLNDETGEGLEAGIVEFKNAIREDGQFAQAYAYVAISYYYLDLYQTEKVHTEKIRNYTDKAKLLNPDLGESLIAEGVYHMQMQQYDSAVISFEEVLDYYPNLGWIHNFLSNIYTSHLPNTEKYLPHALQAIRLVAAQKDSVTASYSYLHLSNALAQTGFIREAETYVKKSLELNPANIYSEYLYVYLRLAQNFNLARTKKDLITIYEKDTTRLEVLQEVAKVCYTTEDFEQAWYYYQKFINLKNAWNLKVYEGEDIKIAYVLMMLGREDEAEKYIASYLAYAEEDASIYHDLIYAAYYATVGDVDSGVEHLKAFSHEAGYQYWLVMFLDSDPILQNLSSHPDFQPTVNVIKDKFWKKHKQIRQMLEVEEVI